jgi:alkylation response protein AidB-like acyl-CoA dehydrogenase
VLPDPTLTVESRDVAAFRTAIGKVIAAWVPKAKSWEADGRIPKSVYVEMARVSAFHDRWRHGRNRGIFHALALADEATKLSPSLSLSLCIHGEVFCGLLDNPRTDYQATMRADALNAEVVGCLASTEPDSGSSIARPMTSARRTARGWRIVGEKRYITNASTASHAVVSTTAEGGQRSGHALFLVDLDAPGVRRLGAFETVGMRGCDTSALALDVEVDDDARLCEPGLGIVLLTKALQMERILAARQLLTSARLALGLTIAHLRRRAIDDVRLMDRQALRHRLADASVNLLGAEALLSYVATRTSQSELVERETAALKLHASQVACQITDEAVQMFGGRGYTANFPLEQLWRDTRIGRIGGGADEVLRDIIAHAIDRDDSIMTSQLLDIYDRDRPTMLLPSAESSL